MDEFELFASARPEAGPLTDQERGLIRSQVFPALPEDGQSQRDGSPDTATVAGPSSVRPTARRRPRRQRVLIAAAAVLVLAASVVAVAATRSHPRGTDVADAGVGRLDEPSSPAPIDGGFANGSTTAASPSAYCGFTVDQLQTAPWAIDGEVMSVTADGPGFWGAPRSLRVRIDVGTWFRGEGSEPEILIADSGELGLIGRGVRRGERVLVAGEVGPDGSQRAWACGFVIPWSPEQGTMWSGVFR